MNSKNSETAPRVRPPYLRVFQTFARNSLVRAMTFRVNFLIECVTSLGWISISLFYYLLIFEYTDSLGADTGWGKYQFLAFLATTLFINSLVEAFFMPNTEEFSELVRTGGLDFALVKPIDTQFLVSLQKIDWASLINLMFASVLLGYSLIRLEQIPSVLQIGLYIVYVLCGTAIFYSLMIGLAATSVWLGRNQTLYEFWFYITNFSRYPMEIYHGAVGTPLRWLFTFVVPLMVATNVPARVVAWPLAAQSWPLALFTLLATAGALVASRRVFYLAMSNYKSASS